MRINDILSTLEKWYPPQLADSWDKVGLQVGSRNSELRNILVCLDITPEVIRESLEQGANLIVTHHPFIFNPVQKLTEGDARFEMIKELLKNDISVYCLHTNLDYSPQGTCDTLAKALNLSELKPLDFVCNLSYRKLVTFVPSEAVEKVSRALFAAGAGHIGEYSECSFQSSGTGTFKGSEDSHPVIGKAGQKESVDEIRLEMIVPTACLSAVIKALYQAHPYEEPAYDVYSLENPSLGASRGVYGKLPALMSLADWAKQISLLLDTEGVRFVGKPDTVVKKAAVVTGSGMDFANSAFARGCDVLLTGDIKYHQAMDWDLRKLALVDAGHYSTEAWFMPHLANRLKSWIVSQNAGINVCTSQVRYDPFQYVGKS